MAWTVVNDDLYRRVHEARLQSMSARIADEAYTLRLAAVVVHATAGLGTQERAEHWLSSTPPCFSCGCQHRKELRTFTGILCAPDRGRSPRGRQASCRVRRLFGGGGGGVVVTSRLASVRCSRMR